MGGSGVCGLGIEGCVWGGGVRVWGGRGDVCVCVCMCVGTSLHI